MNTLLLKVTNKNLTSNHLKLIAILAMLIDHIALGFIPSSSILYQAMRTVGKLTMPIMCYFIAEGYHKTSNFRKYILRLFIFALISHYPFTMYALQSGFNIVFPTSVFLDLVLGLFALKLYYAEGLNKFLKSLLIMIICFISQISDWGYMGVLWILVFGINYNNFKNQTLYFIIVSMFYVINIFVKSYLFFGNLFSLFYYVGIFMVVPLLAKYNGELGNRNNKWFFYAFYPIHLLLLCFIRYLLALF